MVDPKSSDCSTGANKKRNISTDVKSLTVKPMARNTAPVIEERLVKNVSE